MSAQGKRCPKCDDVKDLSEFSKDKSNKDGIRCYCKTCAKTEIDIWRKNNTEKIKKQKSNWRKNNTEKIKDYQANWIENNREKINKQQSNWRKNNPEKAIKYNDKQVVMLTDTYIRHLLGLKKDKAFTELIALKRTHLQITRYLRENRA